MVHHSSNYPNSCTHSHTIVAYFACDDDVLSTSAHVKGKLAMANVPMTHNDPDFVTGTAPKVKKISNFSGSLLTFLV